VNDDVAETAPDAVVERAHWYLRWYPSAWRERYGEEFLAQLENEFLERPHAASRTLDIVLHGVLTRFSLQRAFRRGVQVSLALAVVAGVLIGALAAQQYVPRLPLRITYGDGLSSGTITSTSNKVVGDSFLFTTKSRVAIRITSVSLIGVKGVPTPRVINVSFEASPNNAVNSRGWPPVVIGAPHDGTKPAPIVSALNRWVTVGQGNTIWVALRTSKVVGAYAIEGLKVTYVHRGSSHSFVLTQQATPDLLCVVAKRSTAALLLGSRSCAEPFALADGEATFSHSTQSTDRFVREALAVVSASADFGFYNGRAATTYDERQWSARLFPADSTRGIVRVTALHGTTPILRFLMKGVDGAFVHVCVIPGTFSKEGNGYGLGGPQPTQCPPVAALTN
jgi:hypothetical protein